MSRKEVSVAVIGGGIGGLVAALSLLRAGVDVHVYEQARALSEVGAGVQVSPNASCILHRRDAEMARGTTDWSLKAVAWLYGHDAGAVERGPPD